MDPYLILRYLSFCFLFSSFDTEDDFDYAMIRQIKMEPEAIFSEDDLIAQLQQESCSDLEVEPSFSLENSLNGDYNNEGVIMQHMDIREPLSVLRTLLQERLSLDLRNYSFWLQNAQMVSDKHNIECSRSLLQSRQPLLAPNITLK